jgi:hypothetical protein
MGHYRNEMVVVESDTTKRQQYRQDIEAGIHERVMTCDGFISPDGLASFLADMLDDLDVSGVRNWCRERGRSIRKSTTS